MESIEVEDLVANNSFLFDRIDSVENEFALIDSLDIVDALFCSSPSAVCSGDDDASVGVAPGITAVTNTTSTINASCSTIDEYGIPSNDVNNVGGNVNVNGNVSASSNSSNSINISNSNRVLPPAALHETTRMDMKAVHMEVQENAKIPNVYHIPLRRQLWSEGGGGRSRELSIDYGGGGEAELLDSIMMFDEVDHNLTEKFLMSDNRCVCVYICICICICMYLYHSVTWFGCGTFFCTISTIHCNQSND